MPVRLQRVFLTLLAIATGCAATGCVSGNSTPRVIFLDGAGYMGSDRRLASGLEQAGFEGEVEGFIWTSFLGWGTDHLVAAKSDLAARRLADRIMTIRREHPDGYLAVAGLSSGTAVILNALDRLPDRVMVDAAILFQPSVSHVRNLAPALRHVRNNVCVTCSGKDLVMAGMLVTADGGPAPPAGRRGFLIPDGIPAVDREQYGKVTTVRWFEGYKSEGWSGTHTGSVNPRFVRDVIAPVVLARESDGGEQSIADPLFGQERIYRRGTLPRSVSQ